MAAAIFQAIHTMKAQSILIFGDPRIKSMIFIDEGNAYFPGIAKQKLQSREILTWTL
jgi:hypothetical protein